MLVSLPRRVVEPMVVLALAAGLLVASGAPAAASGMPPPPEWAARLGGTGGALSVAVDTDGAGNSYVTGNFGGAVDFDPGPGVTELTAAGPIDVFVVKLDAAGNLVWARQLGGAGAQVFATGVVAAADGHPHLTGYFSGTVDFDPGPGDMNVAAAGFADSYLVELDDAGALMRAHRLGGSNADIRIGGVAVDAAGATQVTGSFFGTVDFDPGSGENNATAQFLDGFVAKLGDAGALERLALFGGPGATASPDSIALDQIGNAYVTGSFDGTVDFNPGPLDDTFTSAGPDEDAFVLRLDTAGNLVFVAQLGGPGARIHGRAAGAGRDETVWVAGNFSGVADLDPGPGVATKTAAGPTDTFLVHLDGDGTLLASGQLGGPGAEVRPEDVQLDPAGNVFVAGHFTGTADFDPGPGAMSLTAAGAQDGYAAKLDKDGLLEWAGRLGGSGASVHPFELAVDRAGIAQIAGFFTGTADFDLGPGEQQLVSTGNPDAFVTKLAAPVLPPPALVGAVDQDMGLWYLVDPVVADLSGANEVPSGSGDPIGSGRAVVTFNERTGTVCFDLDLVGLDGAVTAAHIHRGAQGVNGPVVVDLDWAARGNEGCVAADRALVDQIVADLDAYYVNVHTTSLPAGAVRGQLGGGPLPPFFYGNPGDQPVLGDWDGDGVDTPGMYRPSDGKVYLRNSNSPGIADIEFFFGDPGDVPLVGDWDGDGDDTIALYRPSLGRFFIHNELGSGNRGLGAAATFFTFGDPFDVPFAGDFDGDGDDTVGVRRGNVFYWRNRLSAGPPANPAGLRFGDPRDEPLWGDWDGDGLETPGLYRPSSSTIFQRNLREPGIADMEIFADGFESGDTAVWGR